MHVLLRGWQHAVILCTTFNDITRGLLQSRNSPEEGGKGANAKDDRLSRRVGALGTSAGRGTGATGGLLRRNRAIVMAGSHGGHGSHGWSVGGCGGRRGRRL